MLADRYGSCVSETFGSAGSWIGLAHQHTAATTFEVQSETVSVS
jgi:hypothetical protein